MLLVSEGTCATARWVEAVRAYLTPEKEELLEQLIGEQVKWKQLFD